jgi:signal transduction histidine kinase
MFFLRFCRRSFPRIEAALWVLIACVIAAVIFTPQEYIFPVIVVRSIASIIVFSLGCFALFYFTWRDRQTDQKILSFGVAVLLVAAIHDVLVTLVLHESNIYYTPAAYEFMLMGMALVLAWRFVGNIQHIRRFNEELTLKVDEARHELATTLSRQHELEVVTARLGERLDLAHDLHDGLGGTLISSIATLEHEPQRIPPQRFLSILREILDDLRLIVDTASSQQPDNQSLSERIATLRHRLTGMCESLGITCRWQTAGLDQCHLPASQSLDLMRILREGITNVLKHSQASRVEIELEHDDGALRLIIRDNGQGFDTAAIDRNYGTGMRSMASRAKRLGGSFAVESAPGVTLLTVLIPDPARFVPGRPLRVHAKGLNS